MDTNVYPLISVVVPIYNVELYIRRCIDSILCQYYQNIEIILVDDGSTDLSGAICDEYELADDRIRVIHKKNGGLSDARNTGLHIAAGELVSFIDSDDFVHPHFLYTLYKELSQNQADIAICGYIKGTKNQFAPTIKPIKYNIFTFNSKELLFQWHSKFKHYETIAWNKLYKIRLFAESGICYPIGLYNEDVLTTHLLVNEAKKIVVIDFPLYYYFQRKNSITGNITEKKMQDYIHAQKQRIKWFCEHGYINAAERLTVKLYNYYMLIYVHMNSGLFKQWGTAIYSMFANNLNYVLGLETISFIQKTIFMLFKKYHMLIRKVTRGIRSK